MASSLKQTINDVLVAIRRFEVAWIQEEIDGSLPTVEALEALFQVREAKAKLSFAEEAIVHVHLFIAHKLRRCGVGVHIESHSQFSGCVKIDSSYCAEPMQDIVVIHDLSQRGSQLPKSFGAQAFRARRRCGTYRGSTSRWKSKANAI